MAGFNVYIIAAAVLSAIILLFVVIGRVSGKNALRRRNGVRDFCLARGFGFAGDESLLSGVWDGDFSPGPEVPVPAGFSVKLKKIFSAGPAPLGFTGLEIFKAGFDRKARNIITVPFGKSSLLFLDYEYSESSDDSTVSYSYTVAAVKTSQRLPVFIMRPENFGDKLLAMIGFEDIDIPGFEEFSKKYCVKGPDKNSVLLFFTPARAMALEKTEGWRMQCSGNYFVLFKKSGYLPVPDYLSFIEETKALLKSLGLA